MQNSCLEKPKLDHMLTRYEVIDFLETHKPILEAEFGVIRIGLFVSYAKEKNLEESDIDFLVELNAPSFDLLAGLHTFLEKKFGKKLN